MTRPTCSLVCRVSIALLAAILVQSCSRSKQVESADALLEQIATLRQQGNYESALATARQLLDMRESRRDSDPYAVRDAERLVESLSRINAFPDSVQRVLAAADGLGDQALERFLEDAFDEARALLEERLRVYEQYLGDSAPEVPGARRDLGDVCALIGDASAAEHFQAALTLDRMHLAPSHPDIALDLLKLVDWEVAADNLATADSLCVQARGIYVESRGLESIEHATALHRLAGIRAGRGEYGAAQVLFQRALATARSLPDAEPSTIAQITNDYAALLHGLGDFAGAVSLFQEVQVIDREQSGENSPEYAATLLNLAAVSQDAGNTQLAESHYLKAAEILAADSLADRETLASCWANLAYAYTDRGEHAKAERLYGDAIAAFRELYGDGDARVATVEINLARDLREQGRQAESEKLYRSALSAARRALGPTHPVVGRCLYSYGSLFDDLGQYARAESLYARAADVFEASRRRLNPGLARATFQESPYLKLANARLNLRKEAAAWLAVERAQSRVLAEMLLAYGRPDLSADERAKEDSLRAVIREFESQAAAYRAEATRDPTAENRRSLQDANRRLAAAEASWSELQQDLAARHPLSEGEPFPLERVQRNLAPRSALVGWIDVEERQGEFATWSYLIKPTGRVNWVRIAPDAASSDIDPFEAARRLRGRLASPSTPADAVHGTARSFWARFAPHAKAFEDVEDLIVVPSGAMLGVPVEAILDPSGAWLGSRLNVAYAPSATVFAWLVEQAKLRTPNLRGALLVGDPPFNDEQLRQMQRSHSASGTEPDHSPADSGLALQRAASDGRLLAQLPRLAGTRQEIQAIGRVLPGARILLGADASEQSIATMATTGELARFAIIHVATHVFIDDRFPQRSFVVLSQANLPDAFEAVSRGDRVYDGLLTGQEIVHDWDLNAELVALSACESGLGQRLANEGYVGFAQSLFQAGARSLLLTLWKVDDRASALLVGRFYENLTGAYTDPRGGPPGRRMSKSEALREAKDWLRQSTVDGERRYEHPFYWSSFVLVGEPSPLP